jgi:hypothetical protein
VLGRGSDPPPCMHGHARRGRLPLRPAPIGERRRWRAAPARVARLATATARQHDRRPLATTRHQRAPRAVPLPPGRGRSGRSCSRGRWVARVSARPESGERALPRTYPALHPVTLSKLGPRTDRLHSPRDAPGDRSDKGTRRSSGPVVRSATGCKPRTRRPRCATRRAAARW